MNTMKAMRRILMGLGVVWGFGAADVQAATNPSSVVGKVYEVRLFQNADCSSGGVTIFKAPSPSPVDFVANPTLGSGAIPNGTYHCVGLKISDVITATPSADDGTECHVGVSFSQDFFVAGNQSHVSYAPDGTMISATGSETAPSEDAPWVYFTDSNVASSSNSCFLPPFGTCACPNTGPCPIGTIVISGDSTRTFVVNFDNAVGDFGNGRCELNAPTLVVR